MPWFSTRALRAKRLKAAILELPHVLVFDNNDLHTPFRRVADFENGKLTIRQKPLPRWLARLLK